MITPGDVQTLSPVFPPSVGQSPFVYAWALFGLLMVTSIALATILRMVSLPGTGWTPSGDPVRYHRHFVILVMLTVVMGAAPDAVMLLLWGEVSEDQLGYILSADKLFDGLAFAPLMLAAMMPLLSRMLRGPQPFFVVARDTLADIKEPWPKPATPLWIIGLCFLISSLVAGTKWLDWVG